MREKKGNRGTIEESEYDPEQSICLEGKKYDFERFGMVDSEGSAEDESKIEQMAHMMSFRETEKTLVQENSINMSKQEIEEDLNASRTVGKQASKVS